MDASRDTALSALQDWYLAQCDDEWEHSYGVSIETLDNPGWCLRIDLRGTSLQDRPFSTFSNIEPETKWLVCEVKGQTFEANCGPSMLEDAIRCFLDWAGAPG